MRTIKTAALTLLAASIPMAVTSLMAGTVVLNAFNDIYPGLGGGEFTAYTSQNFAQYYSSKALVSNQGIINGTSVGFETFCIETGVEFTPGNWGGPTYSYTIGNESEPIPATGAGSQIMLSAGAAYLYAEFGRGLLTDFDYTYELQRQTDDNLLQAAIWALQGNQSYGGYPTPIASNPYYEDAISHFEGLAAAEALNSDDSVQILQMWSSYSSTDPHVTGELEVDGIYYYGAAQNQLVLVPDGGLTIGLLGGALVGLQALRRKFCC